MIGLIDCELKAVARGKTLLGVAARQGAEKPDLDGVLRLRAPASEGQPGGNQGDALEASQRKNV